MKRRREEDDDGNGDGKGKGMCQGPSQNGHAITACIEMNNDITDGEEVAGNAACVSGECDIIQVRGRTCVVICHNVAAGEFSVSIETTREARLEGWQCTLLGN